MANQANIPVLVCIQSRGTRGALASKNGKKNILFLQEKLVRLMNIHDLYRKPTQVG